MLLSVGLQTIRAPDAMDRVLGEAGFGAHGAHRPLGLVLGLGLQRLVYHLGDLLVGDRSRRPRPQLIMQAVEPTIKEALAPLADRNSGHAHRPTDGFMGPAFGRQKDDLGSPYQPVRKTP